MSPITDDIFPQPGNTKGGNSDDEHPGGSITACILIGFLIIVSPNDFSDTDTMGMWRVVFLTYIYMDDISKEKFNWLILLTAM